MTKRKTPQETVHPGLSAEDAATIRNAPEGTTYSYLWRNKYLAIDAASFDEFRTALADAVALLDRWKALGIDLQDNGSVADDYATFYTTSKQVALAEGFMPEPECEDDEDDEEYTEEELHPLFGRRFQWPMLPENLPESPAAFMAAVAVQEQDIHGDNPAIKPYDVTRLAALSGLTELDIRFPRSWRFRGKKNIKHIGDGTHDMSYAEIIWLLHKSVIKDDLGDHVFFENLTPVASGGSVPLFEVFMGS